MLLFTSLNEDAKISGFALQGDVIERLAVYIEDMGVKFAQVAGIVHRKTVFQILIRVLRLCPVDTGRLRGSWTTFMEARGFNGYEKFMWQPSLNPTAKKKEFSALLEGKDEVENGRNLGSFVDAFLNTSITSNVVYASIVNERQDFLTSALIWGDQKYRSNFERFLLATALKEAVVDPIPAGDDGQGGA